MSICDSPPVPVIGLLYVEYSLCFICFYVEFYSGVVLFSFIFTVRVRVRVSYRVRAKGLRLGFVVRVRDR